MLTIAQRTENLSAAERVIQAVLTHADHAYHGRPGIVTKDSSPVGAKWESASYKEENGVKVAYFNRQSGKKTVKVRAGHLDDQGNVVDGGRTIGSYRQPGFFPEVVSWMYRQVADIWKLDNEFAAKWASYAFPQEHKDLKVVLAAFMLVQTRRGDPVMEDGVVLFHDEDYRDVGEAMCLLRRDDNKDLNPRLLLRVGELLRLPEIAAINRELGFSRSMKNPTLGRWPTAVEKWLLQRERNPKMLEGLVKAAYRNTVMALARACHYKPESENFFKILRWKQVQAKTGHRSIRVGVEVEAAESWASLSEAEICARIIATKPSYKRIVGMVPATIGLTRAIVAAAVQSGSLSNQELIIATPTLEDLGLLKIEPVKSKWEEAIAKAENQRASHIASRVKNQDTVAKLEEAADNAAQKAVEEVTRGMMIYFFVDISGSMQKAITDAKTYVAKILAGFPADKIKVAVFNTAGREVIIKHPSKAGVDASFRGIEAAGGTDYGSGVMALATHKPAPDEDVLFFFVGDEDAPTFASSVRASKLNPMAFGLLKIGSTSDHTAVRSTASELQIPCFNIDKSIFADAYAVPRMLRNLIAATPVGVISSRTASARVSLVETVLKTELLKKPVWAA